MPSQDEPSHKEILKAGALLCPVCCIEFLEDQVDMELEGRILRNIKILRCPICQEEILTLEQLDDAIRQSESTT